MQADNNIFKLLNKFHFQFALYVATEFQVGLYNLYFHSCPNYVNEGAVSYDFKVIINRNVLCFLQIPSIISDGDKRI